MIKIHKISISSRIMYICIMVCVAMIHLVRSGLISASLLRTEIKGLRDTKTKKNQKKLQQWETLCTKDLIKRTTFVADTTHRDYSSTQTEAKSERQRVRERERA